MIQKSFLFLICFSGQLFAQNNVPLENSDFTDFRKELQSEYTDFQGEINAEYAEFLSKAWKEYHLFQGKTPDAIPKPLFPVLSQQERDKCETAIMVCEPIDKSTDSKTTPKREMENPIFKDAFGKPGDSLSVDYFGAKLQVSYQSQRFSLTAIAEKSVGNLWKEMTDSRFSSLLAGMLRYKEDMQMNDWAYFLLVEKVASRLSTLQSEDCRTVFQHFLLVQSGYDVRLARVGRFLVLLLPIHEEVYARPYLEMHGQLYYVFSTKDLKSYSSIFTYHLPEKLIRKPHLSLMIHKELLLPMQPKSFVIKAAGLEVKGEVNLNKIRFYQKYPSCELAIYACAASDSKLSKQLLASLSSQLAGKSSLEILNQLLLWVQTGFHYQTDGEQFGYEKPFFMEESFYYPASDCEDRSILFARLVRQLLGREVILLDYPGHVATAVCVDKDKINGAYVELKGKKYIVCDPTYMNAEAGQMMSSYKAKRPKVIRL